MTIILKDNWSLWETKLSDSFHMRVYISFRITLYNKEHRKRHYDLHCRGLILNEICNHAAYCFFVYPKTPRFGLRYQPFFCAFAICEYGHVYFAFSCLFIVCFLIFFRWLKITQYIITLNLFPKFINTNH